MVISLSLHMSIPFDLELRRQYRSPFTMQECNGSLSHLFSVTFHVTPSLQLQIRQEISDRGSPWRLPLPRPIACNSSVQISLAQNLLVFYSGVHLHRPLFYSVALSSGASESDYAFQLSFALFLSFLFFLSLTEGKQTVGRRSWRQKKGGRLSRAVT